MAGYPSYRNISMNQSTSLYLSAIRSILWEEPKGFSFPEGIHVQTVLEQGSLSRLLAQHCQQLKVNVLNNQPIAQDCLSDDEQSLLLPENCWLREVVLQGDNTPWVIGRTLIPESTIRDPQHDLSKQGDRPLGLTVFSADNVYRDALQVGWVKTPHGRLLARRSRLWMNHKPMLVAELFLPKSPVYSKERI